MRNAEVLRLGGGGRLGGGAIAVCVAAAGLASAAPATAAPVDVSLSARAGAALRTKPTTACFVAA